MLAIVICRKPCHRLWHQMLFLLFMPYSRCQHVLIDNCLNFVCQRKWPTNVVDWIISISITTSITWPTELKIDRDYFRWSNKNNKRRMCVILSQKKSNFRKKSANFCNYNFIDSGWITDVIFFCSDNQFFTLLCMLGSFSSSSWSKLTALNGACSVFKWSKLSTVVGWLGSHDRLIRTKKLRKVC